MRSPLPYFALVFNALVWGLSWWPLRELHALGYHHVRYVDGGMRGWVQRGWPTVLPGALSAR